MDGFLYARCCAVANGPSFYESVLKNPSSMLNPFYEVRTEDEWSKGFVDTYLHPITSDVRYGAAIELKYIKRDNLTGGVPEKTVSENMEQLDKYTVPENVLKILLVFHGWEFGICVLEIQKADLFFHRSLTSS